MPSAQRAHAWGHLPEVTVTADGPFAVGSVLWRDKRGQLMCTVVAKATYELVQGESAPSDVPLPIQEEDVHWDDDPSRSVHVPSDLAPFKTSAEVVVVGSAFAPNDRPARSTVARVLVGSVDKAVECFPQRRFRLDGNVDDAAPLVRFSLRYEHAAGGPGTDNPAGIDVSRGDVRGRRPIPPLLPPGHMLGAPGEHIPTAGFGPIAARWPSRNGGLGPHERAWIERPAASPMPETLPSRYFQAAPPDQWLDRPLAANERVVLENLHARHARLVTSLAGIEPRAFVAGAAPAPLRLTGDLLFIDTDRALCTLTFRGQIPMVEGRGRLRVVVAGVPMGTELSADSVRALFDEAGADDDETSDEIALEPEDAVISTTQMPAYAASRPALPFSRAVPPARPSAPGLPDGALPFRGTPAPVIETAPAPVAAPPKPPPAPPSLGIARDPTAPPFPPEPPPPPPVVPRVEPLMALRSEPVAPVLRAEPAIPPPVRPEPVVMPPPVRPEPAPPPPAVQPLMSLSAAPAVEPSLSFTAARPEPRPASEPAASKPSSFDAAFGGKSGASKPAKASSFDAAFGGVKAASDAAADKERTKEAAPPGKASKPAEEPPKRIHVVDLLHFEPKAAPRLKALKRFAYVWVQPARPRPVQSLDEPRTEAPAADRERADVLRVLSFGRPEAAHVVRRALADSLDDAGDLDPPLVLVAGELRPTFDEIEQLRATVAIAQPVAGTDKKLLSAIAVAQEALGAQIPPRPDATLGFARQIENASLSLSLPVRYVAAEVERVLLEGRKYKRRPLFGATRVRADLIVGGEALTVYLPDSVTPSLPLLPAYPVVALCEVRPREDVTEAQEEALLAVALGRVLKTRGEEKG
jgi:hypothetical protein